ncbi:MAG: hypothetical protein ABIR30_08040 [Chitinophagaceae bacterium]
MRSLFLFVVYGMLILAIYSCRSNVASISINDTDRRIIILPDSAYAISSDINDADDPIRLFGIDFIAEDHLPVGDLSIRAISSNTSVVPNENLVLTGNGVNHNLKIKPIAAGYATITIAVTDGVRRYSYTLNYAVSKASTLTGKRWHTGIADASAAIVIDEDYMIVANDESNYLYLYNRHHSGLPVQTFDFNQGNILGLTDSSGGKWKEVDVEAGVRSSRDPSVIYWIGSMSNNGSFFDKPNRNRLFAISVSGKGAAARFTNAGYYSQLRQKLISWGNEQGYNFDSSAAVGKDSKKVNGFNIEGMVFGPDNKTLYIAFRAPLIPVTSRSKAVIAPVLDFENWFNNGSPASDPRIGAPIELDLGGNGIRDLICLPNGNYVIIAGSCGWELTPAVYVWSGKTTDAPVKVHSFSLDALNVEGVLPVEDGDQLSLNKLQLLTDNGKEIFYGDTICAKDLYCDNLKKFSSVIIELIEKNSLR